MAGSLGLASAGTLQRRLLLHVATRRQQAKGMAQAGFTLVELMIVIVIVGILAAIAIPNFLKQTEKAKATEAKSAISAILKQAQAQYQEDGASPRESIADMITFYGAPTDATTKFNYDGKWVAATAPATGGVYSVTATGVAGDIKDKVITGCVDVTTGIVDIQSILGTATAPGTPTKCTKATT